MALLQAEIPLWKITKDGWPENRASRGVCRGSGLASGHARGSWVIASPARTSASSREREPFLHAKLLAEL
ncbi:MAG: hypothetical protein DME37_09910 [Verrucomicrobia bacterium]|nr:MAG: hypothetical protein DME37_09910 [Verrucomicrobiota bacterium]